MKMNGIDIHYECDGNVVIYKRPFCATSNYYARVKLPKIGKWKKFTTKTDDKDQAIRFAVREYDKIQMMLENGLVIDTRSFSQVADYVIKELQEQLDSKTGKVVFEDYIRYIKRFKEFFGRKYISNIGYNDLVEFDKERTKKLGRKACSSTISTQNAALARVFEYAIRKHWMHQSQAVIFKNDGRKGKRRPYFDLHEYRRLYRYLREYVKLTTKDSKKGGVTNRSIMIRELLRDYVLFLANTGMRHGTETRNLKWKNISDYTYEGVSYIKIRIEKGKTGERTIIARHNVRKYLERIKSRFEHLANLSFNELANVDELVFRLADGSLPKDLHGAFEKVLADASLLFNSNGERRSLYSLRHTYATFAILYNKIDFHTLSKNMGTSIAMLERHYSHLQVIHRAKELAGLLKIKEPKE